MTTDETEAEATRPEPTPFPVGARVRYTGGEDDGPLTVVGYVPHVEGWWVRVTAERDGHTFTRVYPATELRADAYAGGAR